jgi:hypothetical protein
MLKDFPSEENIFMPKFKLRCQKGQIWEIFWELARSFDQEL